MLKEASQIYRALKSLGLSKSQVKILLPEWWSEDIEKTPDGVSELAIIISRRFNLKLEDLLIGEASFRENDFGIAYKHASSIKQQALGPATHIAKALINAVIGGMRLPYSGVPSNPLEVESEIRKVSTSGLPDLEAIARYCWKVGVPVVPLAQLPTGLNKMDGAVMNIQGRPSIVLSRNTTSKSWLSFILAHELGHIALGHLINGTAIVDVKLAQEATHLADKDSDDQEEQANQFALRLLGGGEAETELIHWSPRLTSTEIALKALEFQATHKFPAGHIALRYGFKYKRWVDAQNALRFMPQDRDDNKVLANIMKEQIDIEMLGKDSVELIARLTEEAR